MNRHIAIALAFAAALSAGAPSFISAASARHAVASGSLGKGTVVLWKESGRIGASIDKAALDSLPAAETRVDLTAQIGPYRLVEIDWHPHGHLPKGIYDVPHFDAHFYVIDKMERDAIAFAPPGGVAKPSADKVPAGYVSDGTVIPQMGMHFASVSRPEFHGKPFMCSQIWGYNAGRFAFVEAMFSKRFVSSGASFFEPIARADQTSAGIRGTMSVHPNAGGGYEIVLAQ